MSTSNAQHQMRLVTTYPSGAEEWLCPICGRRFVMHFQAKYQKLNILVLEDGDRFANHTGSTNGLTFGSSPEVEQNNHNGSGGSDDEPMLSSELRQALEEALEDIDMDDWPV